MVDYIKKSAPAVAALSAGALVGVVAMALGTVFYTGESFGSESEPPEQIYFF